MRALPQPDTESLRWALELAVRNENYEEAARLRTAVRKAEVERPVTALESLALDRVRIAVAGSLDSASPMLERLQAVRCLQVLATPPVNTEEAEDGLHRLLQESDEDEVAEMAEAALWAAWLCSGDELVDTIMRRGLQFMGAGELDKATQAFTEAVELAPAFAEAWNKRATAFFLAERFDESIEDCFRVLELKPRHFGCLSGLGICHLRKGDERGAARWLREALAVNPRSSDMQRIVADLEGRAASALLRPRIQEVLAELTLGRPVSAPAVLPTLEPSQVHAGWDAFRIRDADKFTYLFRVRVKCLGKVRVASLGRYYALKHAGGSAFPLMRLTQGSASFSLGPQETYCYSFMLTFASELLVAQGGLLLRCGEDIFEAGLQRLALHRADVLGEDDVARMNDGYNFMGGLDIRIED